MENKPLLGEEHTGEAAVMEWSRRGWARLPAITSPEYNALIPVRVLGGWVVVIRRRDDRYCAWRK
jgi:hypothetical protein